MDELDGGVADYVYSQNLQMERSKMSYTPKPWKLIDSSWYPTVRIVGPNGEGLASFGNQQRWLDRPTVWANARLMTVAPELLEVCEAALAHIESTIRLQEGTGGAIPDDTLHLRGWLHNTIAKATGQ